jgi:mono/diheme cytochrome c family protein
MKSALRYRAVLSALVVAALVVMTPIAMALQTETPQPQQLPDPVGQGAYLTYIAGCIFCHTPYQEKFNDPTKLGLDDIKIVALAEGGALDTKRLFAGGRDFDLGPLGHLYTRNLTPDKETGIGNWTNDEIKTILRTGKAHDGHLLFPVMPFLYYSQMADSDLDSIIAYLRSLPPVNNKVQPNTIASPLPGPLPLPKDTIVAPDPKDTEARGKYLMTAVLPCGDCHTPVDPNTGAAIMDEYLGGGQPYDGPWGTVYGGNITPDKATGIGSWTDDQIKKVLREGVLPDGRRVVLMPWQMTSVLTDDDLAAVIYFLRNDLKPVKNEVPKPSLNSGFEVFAEK